MRGANVMLIVVVSVALAVVALFAAWWGGQPSRAAGPVEVPRYTVEVLVAGEGLFASSCAACHGDAGEGTALGPGLDASMFTFERSDRQLREFVRNGRGSMPAVAAGWSDDDVTAVLAHVKGFWTDEQREEHARRVR